ncbi:hypothetical protein EVAR_8583_1 [Eumeta japonica]|uniref:Uncharacterized protein n=1 Tax=Eumeta variegata TaxID=151549 RepID=A0A4C2A7J2_EUMVA|nr:hypothetical protein EVAR_8583_1 [Eumeta japonica]
MLVSESSSSLVNILQPSQSIESSRKSYTNISDLYNHCSDYNRTEERNETRGVDSHLVTAISDISDVTECSRFTLPVHPETELHKNRQDEGEVDKNIEDKAMFGIKNETTPAKNATRYNTDYCTHSKRYDKDLSQSDLKNKKALENCTNQMSLVNHIPETSVGFYPLKTTSNKEFIFFKDSLTEKINNDRDTLRLPDNIELGKSSDAVEGFVKNVTKDVTASCEYLITEITNEDSLDSQDNVTDTEKNLEFFNKDWKSNNEDHVFLKDFNEPSTSKGRKHYCIDVQCGSDIVIDMMSKLSSNNLNRITSESLTTLDSIQNISVHTERNVYETNSIKGRLRSTTRPVECGIKIKDTYYDTNYSEAAHKMGKGKETENANNSIKMRNDSMDCKIVNKDSIHYFFPEKANESSKGLTKDDSTKNTSEMKSERNIENADVIIRPTDNVFKCEKTNNNDVAQKLVETLTNGISDNCSTNSSINASIKLNVISSQVTLELIDNALMTKNVIKEISNTNISSKLPCHDHKELLSTEDIPVQDGWQKDAINTFSRRKHYANTLRTTRQRRAIKGQSSVLKSTTHEKALSKEKTEVKSIISHKTSRITKVNSVLMKQNINDIVSNGLEIDKNLASNLRPRLTDLANRHPGVKSCSPTKKLSPISLPRKPKKILSMETLHDQEDTVDLNITLAIERVKYAIQTACPREAKKKKDESEKTAAKFDLVTIANNNAMIDEIVHSIRNKVNESVLEDDIDKICDSVNETKNPTTRSLSNETVVSRSVTRKVSMVPSVKGTKVENAGTPPTDDHMSMSQTPDISYSMMFSEKNVRIQSSGTTVSKISEYYLADTEFVNLQKSESKISDVAIVKNIFERQAEASKNVPVGNLALQVFSGYSVNEPGMVPNIGDSGNCVHLADSGINSVVDSNARRANLTKLIFDPDSALDLHPDSALYSNAFGSAVTELSARRPIIVEWERDARHSAGLSPR